MSNQTPGLADPGEIQYARDLAALKATAALQHGCLTEAQLPELVRLRRLDPVLVRCGGGRFQCPAQDVAHFVAIIERDAADHVRDINWGGAM